MNFFSVFLLLLVVGFVSCSDEETTEGGIRLKVVGRSGKIKVGNASYVNVDEDPDRIMLSFDSITEVDNHGDTVGNTGKVKHTFNSFASQDFQFTPLVNTELQEVKVQKFDFSCTLEGLSSTIKVTMYIFREDGNITVFGDNMRVRRGQIKFNIRLSNWMFCGDGPDDDNCIKGGQAQRGDYVDFDIEIKSKGRANKTEEENRQNDDDLDEYDLGVGYFRVTNTYQWDKKANDIETENMVAPYPKVTTKDNKQIFTFRFGRFHSFAEYDPIIQYGDSYGDDGGRPGGAGRAAMSLSLISLIMAIGYFFN